MRLSQICIDRPVLTIVMSLGILLFGIIAVDRLPNRELPDVDPPVVSVTTIFPGAAAEVVETSVTQVLEDQIIAIDGVKHVTSLSREQVSSISVEFELYRDVDLAANDVRDRVARARRNLPDDVEQPIVAKRDADDRPVLWIALSGASYDQIQISTIADTQIRDRLAKLPGVANVILGGERRYSMRLWLDNPRLRAHNLTVADVAEALRRENVDIPSGRIEGESREFTVRALGELRTPEAYGDLIIANIQGQPIRLRDVGRAEVGPEDERKLVRFNGNPAIGLGIVRQSKANTLDVIRAVKAELDAIEDDLPAGLELVTAFDSSIYIQRAIRDVTFTIFQAVALVVFVIYLFLRTFRATLLPAVAIPVSIVGTFAVLYFLDFSINTLTLMGLTLAIGLVVDDAIVVLENITRWIEQGATRMEAAREGMKEISFAVVAATVSTVAVFLPLTFLTDTTGRLFREFAVTIASAVAISGFVALTLTPMLASRVLRTQVEEHGFKRMLALGFERMARGYGRALDLTLHRPGVVLLIGAAWVGLGFLLLEHIDREFIPTADRGSIITFTRAPEGSTIEYTARYHHEVDEIVLSIPEVDKSFSVVALGLGTPGVVNEGALFTSLKLWEDRERSQQEIIESLRPKLARVTGVQAFPASPAPLGQRTSGSPVSLIVQGPNIANLARYADEIARRAREIPGLVNVRTDLIMNKPQLEVRIDRDRASDLGVTARDLATTLQILLGGLDLSTFKLHGETYKVIVQLERSRRSTPRDVSGLYVRGREGRPIPLISVVDVRETIAPRGLPHFDRLRSANVTASLVDGAPLGNALEQIRRVSQEVLPEGKGYRSTFSGQSEQFYESESALLFAYVLALIVVYLVLAAQFESFLHPITIMVAVALSFAGALVTLELSGATLNLFSQIGLVMLVGLVTKNSILIVEFANQLRARGRDVGDAIREAARIRFRPILMTALSTAVGILPIALGRGAGGEARAPLGIAVVGGVLFATLLTFFVVPATYLALNRAQVRAAAWLGRVPVRAVTR
ncbi:MAG: efflux RND transporter permease subunit [Deltaproteobacteria bacterium]|nr:MAG: efflux RND transporter permease subunit [Deltaproteobacteria bacterium]